MSASQLSVVVIDKHPLMRTALSSTLASAEKVDVIAEYATVNELFANFGKFFPNMILLGIANPGTNELSMIRHLRSFFPLAQVFVLVTGELQGQEEEALQYGAHAVWQKTISREELLRGLEMQFNNYVFSKEKSNVQFQS